MTDKSLDTNPISSLNTRLGEITGLAAGIVLLIAGLSKITPERFPYTTIALIVLISSCRFCWWRWGKINLKKPVERSVVFTGKEARALVASQSRQFRLPAVINQSAAIYQMTYPRRCLELLLLALLVIFTVFWVFISRNDIVLEITGVPSMLCTPSNQNSGLTILVARFNQVAGTPSLIENRAFDALAAHVVGDMRVCSTDQVVSRQIDAQNLGRLTKASLVVWGRIDAVFEINLEAIGETGNSQPIFQLASGDVLDNYSFQLDSSEEIDIVTAFTASQLFYRDNRIKDAQILLMGALSSAEYKQMWKTNPAIMVEPYFFLGFLFDGDHDSPTTNLDEAIKDYSRAIQLDPTFYRAYLNRAVAFAAKDPSEYDKARADYQFLIDSLSPFVQVSYLNLADLDVHSDKRELAEQEFAQAIAYASSSPIGYTSRGMAYMYDWDEPSKAVADFKKALSLAPDSPDSYIDLGQAQLAAGQTSEAVDTYRQLCPYLTSDVKEEIVDDLSQLAVDTAELQPTINDIKKGLNQCLAGG